VLHRSSKLEGFHVLATDGAIGHVDEFLFDELGWTVRYLVVDTSNWIGGRSVLVSTSALESVDPVKGRFHVRLTRDEIARSPSIDTADIPLVETLPTVWIM
jgi:hypothetical protein